MSKCTWYDIEANKKQYFVDSERQS